MELRALPQDTAVVLRWRTVGGPALPLLLISVLSPFLVVAVLITLQAMGVPVLALLPGGSGKAGASLRVQVGMTAFTALIVMAWLVPLDAWLWSRQELTISPRGLSYRRRSPLVGSLGWLFGEPRRRWDATLDQIESVQSNHEVDAVEIRLSGRTRRVLVHLAVDGEVVWLAATVRTLVSSMRDVR